jgi:hypothetical protein
MNDHLKLIKFYESLNSEQRMRVDEKFQTLFPNEKLPEQGVEQELFILKCAIAFDMFSKKIIKG